MRLTENIRTAERKSLASMRQKMDRAKQEWGDVERRIRQKMRVYPQKLRSRFVAGHEAGPEQELVDSTKAATVAEHGPRPIISINGADVPEHEIEKTLN